MESERRAPVKILKPGPKPNPDQPKFFPVSDVAVSLKQTLENTPPLTVIAH